MNESKITLGQLESFLWGTADIRRGLRRNKSQ